MPSPRAKTRTFAQAIAADAAQAVSPSPVWARCLTTPLSLVYRSVVALRGASFEAKIRPSRKLPGRTIAIGNLVAGGTGKSPVAAKIAALLTARGHKVAILTRGWGSGLEKNDSAAYLGGEVLMAAQGGAKDARADEAFMQSAALPEVPVVIGADRFRAAMRFVTNFPHLAPTYWLLDDGFQHRQIERDLNIVLLDAARPFGNGQLLPRGPLREPTSALRRADVVIFTRASDRAPDDAARARVREHFSGPSLLARFVPGPMVPIGSAPAFDLGVHGIVIVASGIARPEQFIDQVRRSGMKIAATYVVGDHERFIAEELRKRTVGARAVVTTAKDYWRDPTVFAGLAMPVYVQELVVEWDTSALEAALAPVLVER